jgi:hypothetical protein
VEALMATQLDIEFVASVENFRKEVERIPGITKKQTREMVAEFQRGWKQSQQVAGTAIDQIAKDAGNLQRIGGLVGGPLGTAMQVVADVSESASAGLSSAAKGALALGAGAAVVGALGTVIASVVTNLDDYRETIADLEGRGIITPQQARAIEAMSAAITVIKDRMTDWAVILTSKVAPAFNQMLLGGQYAITNLSTLVAEVGGDLATVGEKLWKVWSSGFDSAALSSYRVAVQDMIDMEGELAIAAATAEEAARGWVADVSEERGRALREYGADAREAAKNAREEVRKAHEGMASDIAATLSPEMWERVWSEGNAARIQFEQESMAGNAAWARGIQQNMSLAGDAVQGFTSQQANAAQAAEQAARTSSDAWMGAASAIAGATTSLLGAIQGMLAQSARDHAQNSEDMTVAEKRELRKRFKAQKALAHASIWINASVAFMQAMAQLGPIAGAIVGALALGAAGIQSAMVEKQNPPFDRGGMIQAQSNAPDHVGITAMPGEAVLSRQAVSAVGGPRGVDNLNRRGRAAMGGGSITAMVIGGRVLDAMWAGGGTGARAGLAARVRSAMGVTGRRERAWGG